MLKVAHLVDDQNPGGVTRYLDFIARDPDMACFARHEVVPVTRDRPFTARLDADVVVSHLTVTWRGLPGLMALRARHAGRTLLHVEHSYSAGFVAHNVTARRRFYTLLRTGYALFDRVVAVSEGQADWLIRRALVPAEALSVIRPCVDLGAFRALAAPSDAVRVIAAVGRFDRQKGFDLLIRAFRRVARADLRLRLVGDGPERATLEALAAGDPRITFGGFVGDVSELLAHCDAVAMPSRWEPYGLVALEALTAGRPLLVSPIDGLKDHVAAGARPVPAFSEEAWAHAIEELVTRKPAPIGMPGFTPETRTIGAWRDLLTRADRAKPVSTAWSAA
jgi:glycosyltransferase involved in cell wall biosynthesis